MLICPPSFSVWLCCSFLYLPSHPTSDVTTSIIHPNTAYPGGYCLDLAVQKTTAGEVSLQEVVVLVAVAVADLGVSAAAVAEASAAVVPREDGDCYQ